MARERGGDVIERQRPVFLIAQPGGDDDANGVEGLAVIEGQAKAIARCIDLPHRAPVNVGDGVLLEPFAIGNECFERQVPVRIDAMCRRIGVERPGAVRIG